jgi:hypothetical protein
MHMHSPLNPNVYVGRALQPLLVLCNHVLRNHGTRKIRVGVSESRIPALTYTLGNV